MRDTGSLLGLKTFSFLAEDPIREKRIEWFRGEDTEPGSYKGFGKYLRRTRVSGLLLDACLDGALFGFGGGGGGCEWGLISG